MVDVALDSRARADFENFHVASRFLAFEASLLDQRRFDDWLDLLDEEIIYEVPIRLAKASFADETRSGGHRMYDTKARLRTRVDRLNCNSCWSESPPSRTLRVVGSVIASATDRPDVLEVESALLLYRQRSDDAPGDVLAARRVDLIRTGHDGVKLLRRRALIADTVLRTPNLGVFL